MSTCPTSFRLAGLCVLLFALATFSFAQQRESDLDRYSDIARRALDAKKWSEAVEALKHLARLAPEVPEVHANLGLAYFFEGLPAEALGSFERAQKLKPQLPQVEVMIGLSEAELGRCTEAISILTSAFDRPVDADTGRLTGLHLLRCYSQLKQPDKALVIGETLLGRYPADPEILYHVSRLHAERSTDLMSTLLRTAPDSAWMHYANAQVQESLDRSDAAAQEYRHALEKDPKILGVHYKLGRLILNGSRSPGSLEKARREFEQELALSPANADGEYEIGEICREKSQPNEALTHFERAIQYHPDFVEARVATAKTLLELGHPADAVPHLQAAERLDPENKIPHYLLASAYRSLGDLDKAAKEFAVYRKLGASPPSAAPQSSSSDRN
jgi:tetratricopeptide (TPR) repeat protein